MKSWKEQPHLFWGFKVTHRARKPHEADVIDGLFLDSFTEYWDDEMKDSCKLIARPIIDMTDEEIKKLGEFGSSIWDDPSEDLDFYQVVYLLSIGCYPFNQEDFETGEVLDAKEVV